MTVFCSMYVTNYGQGRVYFKGESDTLAKLRNCLMFAHEKIVQSFDQFVLRCFPYFC